MDSLEITDVTLRDGLQMEGKVISTQDKLTLYDKLSALGHRRLEVTSFVHPKWVSQFADSESFCQQLESRASSRGNTEWMAFVPNEKGLERLLPFSISWASAFIATSERFNEKNVNQSIGETLEVLSKLVSRAHKEQRKIRIYVSTVFGCPYEGKIEPGRLMELLKEVAALQPDEITLSDTIGVAIPSEVREVLEAFARVFPVRDTALHLHNTYGFAAANADTAFEMGIRKFDGSSGGIGGCPYAKGATGNVATEELTYSFFRRGVTEFSLTKWKSVLEFLRQDLGLTLHSRISDILEKGGKIYGLE